MVRPRTLFKLGAERLQPHYIRLNLTSQAGLLRSSLLNLIFTYRLIYQTAPIPGTYIKEFVHGDFGRTVPSLKDVLHIEEADILSLDVSGVDLEWPPAAMDLTKE